MPQANYFDKDFLLKATEIVEDHLSDERFGVSELAGAMGMSRSNLLRKIQKLTGLSVSRFVRQIRLKHAKELLVSGTINVSEAAWKTGFSSTSYFVKCFREQYGYPPGEVSQHATKTESDTPGESSAFTHQLAAIMFTDIEGYTALMQKDEHQAVAFRNRHRKIFNAAIEKYNGKILQYYGDGTLSTFSSAIDAVKCGIEMQLDFLQEPELPVRIGIHSGDIIFTHDDIIGDGVNVASRIESLAVSGSVFISEKVFDEIKNQPGIKTVSMGRFDLKNIDKPIEVYAIANKGLTVPEKSSISGKTKSQSQSEISSQQFQKKNKTLNKVLFAAAMVLVIFILYFSGIFNKSGQQKISGPDDQSIAVLPFINDSPDSSNVYIVNGLMESILNNLQKIGNLRVVSRTSVERFRNAGKTIPEIAKELNVKYLIEGSGQKMGDQIKLSIQLIEGHSDRHLWAQQYDRDTKDIFKLQSEIAAHIAGQIKVIVTPQEQNRINKPPTENLQAYDHYLKGRNFLNQGTTDGLKKSITWFRKSVEEDETFAIAYADLAIAYFYMDIFKQEKTFTDSLGYFADKAMFNDSHAVESLIAKALYHTNTGQYEQALPYLEKAHEYNPNSTFVINLLSEYYTNQLPDSEKYLEYALKGIRLDIGAQDSATTSITYLHLANAFIQLGFIAEAERYINKSLDFDTNNIYSHYVKAYIIYARNRNLKQTENLLLKTLARDTMRLDVLQEIGKVFFYQRNYPASFKYYKRFLSLKEELNWDIYSHENAKIGFVYHQMGLTGEADTLFRKYFDYAQNDRSIYQNLSLAVYYAYSGNSEEALKQLKLFAEINKYNYWTILFLDIDPLMDNLQNDPGFDEMIQLLNSNFYERHERIKHSLTVKGLI